MFHRTFQFAAIALAALLSHQQSVSAADSIPLERWRSYAGVSWKPSKGGKDPAPFAASVSAPIAGLHFDAQGSAYVSTPRLVSAGAPATLSTLDTRAKTGPARLTAFPSTEGNAVTAAPDQNLRNVLGFHVDRKNGWLWALDMGFVAGEAEAPVGAQKVLVLDLKSGRTVKRIALDGVADRKGSFLNDIAVDERRRIAYIADSGMRSAPNNMVGLIVVDFASAKARRLLDKHPSLQIEPGVKVVSHGAEVWPGNPLLLGINGIALSPDARTLYWTVTTGTRARSVPTSVLRDAASSDEKIAAAIRDLGAVGGNTDGIVTDAKGRLYITDVTNNGIVRYNPRNRTMSLIASNEGVQWPDTPTILPDGDLVFTSSALNNHFAGSVKNGEERYELWRLPIGGRKAKAD
ncbi:sugar lactone lactonase YvrE [Variovorax boronicumulans]|uniref:L-dopachrome tautomerase-related protein n=1 Tax=Variovorax boronicumulans TaxID=436515 RepID=UPI0027863BA9|nr:L-dopachrome tautomerase-related protein [Variovorax boronicumulans]MDQ0083882.1 sugar lactone lactonase YvrE [Variovorax boronicumulans]